MADFVVLVLNAVALIPGPWQGFFVILAIAANVAYAEHSRRQALREAREAWARTLTDQTVMFKGGVTARDIVYGRVPKSGPIVAAFSSGTLKEYLWLVVPVAGHAVDAFETAFFNESKLTLDGSGNVTDGLGILQVQKTHNFQYIIPDGNSPVVINLPFTPDGDIISVTFAFVVRTDQTNATVVPFNWTPGTSQISITTNPGVGKELVITFTYKVAESYARFFFHLGADNQLVDSDLNAALPIEWDSSHRLAGCAYFIVRFRYNRKVWTGGLPNPFVVLRGKRLYDPRKDDTVGGSGSHRANDPSTWEWSAVPVLCGRDYILSTQGLAADSNKVSIPYTISESNICDELIDITDRTRAVVKSEFNVPGDMEGWAETNAAGVVSDGKMRLSAVASDPSIAKSDFTAFAGTTYRSVRLRIKRIAGTGWQGDCFYSTSGHGYGNGNNTFYKHVAEPTYDSDGWAVISFDMSALDNGGTDWITNNITGIRLDLGSTATDVFDIDWIYFGAENTQKRYECHGVISMADDRGDALARIESTMAGHFHYTQGMWKPQAGAFTTPAITITEVNLSNTDAIQIVPYLSRQNLLNACKARFFDEANSYSQAQSPEWSAEALIVADGGRKLTTTIILPMTTNEQMALRLQKIAVLRTRESETVILPCNLSMYTIALGDTVYVKIKRYGWDTLNGGLGKSFRVFNRKFSPKGGIPLTLVEESATRYLWDHGENVSYPVDDNTALPKPFDVAKPVIVEVNSGQGYYRILGDGTVQDRIRVEIDPITEQYVLSGGYLEIDYSVATLTPLQWIPAGRYTPTEIFLWIDGVQPGQAYIIRVRAVNSNLALSDYAMALHLVGPKTLGPVAPTTFTVSILAAGVRHFEWTYAAQPDYDISGFEIRYQSGATITWASATVLAMIPYNQLSSGLKGETDVTKPGIGTWSFEIRAINRSGVYGSTGKQLLNQSFTILPGAPPDGSVTFPKLGGPWFLGGIVTPDPGFEDLTAWDFTTGAGTVSRGNLSGGSGPWLGRYYFQSEAADSVFIGKPVPITEGRTYLAVMNAIQSGGSSTRIMYMLVAFYDQTLTVINPVTADGWPASPTGASFHYWGVTAVAPPASWTQFTQRFGPSSAATFKIPGGARFMAVGCILAYAPSGGSGKNAVNGARILDVAMSDQIGPGAILDVHLPDGEIRGPKLANAGTGDGITTPKIEDEAISVQSRSLTTNTPDTFSGSSPLSSTGVKDIGSIGITTVGGRVRYTGTGYLAISTHTTQPAYLQVTMSFYRNSGAGDVAISIIIFDINTAGGVSIGQFIAPIVWSTCEAAAPAAGAHTYKVKINVDAYNASRSLVAGISVNFSYYHLQTVEEFKK